MKIKSALIILLLLTTFSNADEIKRKLLSFYDDSIGYIGNDPVHSRLESILNYYGYYVENIPMKDKNIPKDVSEYAGLIIWNYKIKDKNPVKLANFIAKFKNKKNIFIGNIPFVDEKGNDYSKEVNKILKDNFGFTMGSNLTKNARMLKLDYDKKYFDFEKKTSFLTKEVSGQVKTFGDDKEIVFKESYNKRVSNSAFFAHWGFYARADIVFYGSSKEGGNRWILDPFKMVSKVFSNKFPIPETTTKNGKRIAYIHLDGDGILSKSYNHKYTIENAYDYLSKIPLKTGISFIALELDKNGPIFKNPLYLMQQDFKPALFNNYAKKLLNLPNVEPASHTYTHPFSWRKGIISYTVNKDAKKVLYGGKIPAFQEKDKQINLKYEVLDSIAYIQKLVPSKKVNILYWSGDCYPSIRDLKYIEKHNILAFNGGDNRFDMDYNSYSYTYPIGIYNKEATQIYSSNSNENTYTNDWTENFWKFKKVITTFKNTGYPKRIKPVNLYYHFYNFAKKASFNSLKSVYKYMEKGNFEFIYPSEFIKIARNFYDVKIDKISNNTFEISNIKALREFRFDGKHKISSKDIVKTYYNKKLDVTYFRVKDKIKKAKIRLDI